jgi:tRNA U34 5-methylaminomethyl-2-thiouridine-forming methyltransferase MnmC
MKKNGIKKRVNIFSPELDGDLVCSLKDFDYPDEFKEFLPVIKSISDSGEYVDENLHVKVVIGDAREYLLTCKERFDIVYQDAFSPLVNPILWTKEYFADISRVIRDDGILTTYSMAFKTRLALYENGFNIYINSGEGFRDSTLASKSDINVTKVDMEHKISCNSEIKSLCDVDYGYN